MTAAHAGETEGLGVALRETASLATAGAGVFLGLALISFDAGDYGSIHYPPSPAVSNLCGRAGAWLALGVLQDVGTIAAYLLALVLVSFALRGMRRGTVGAARVLGAAFLLFAVSAFEHVAEATAGVPGPLAGRLSGGFVGTYLGARLLASFQVSGALIVLGVIGGMAFLVTFERVARSASSPVPNGDAGAYGLPAAEVLAAPEPKGAAASDAESRESPATHPAAAAPAEVEVEVPPPSARPPVPPPAVLPEPPQPEAAVETAPVAGGAPYVPPKWTSLLVEKAADDGRLAQDARERAHRLQEGLGAFRIAAEVVGAEVGPNITMFELRLAPGTRVQSVVQRTDDLAVALKAPSIRVVAPLPGRSTIGLEVPNPVQEIVRLRELIESFDTQNAAVRIPLFLGKSARGEPLVLDLAAMPHLLIAGATGSGKSVSVNAMIMSILMTRRPDEAKLILIDPKMVELSLYEGIPHLLSPVVTDMRKAQAVLEWAVAQMEDRYRLLQKAEVRHVDGYNAIEAGERLARMGVEPGSEDAETVPEHIPHIVIVIDEMADLMMVARKEVEASITRLAQKSRAVGIHLILATQRPSVDVITGLIKANLPTRVAFQVTSAVDSRTILDQNGAERLIGQGDMLLLPPRSSTLVRAQGTYVEDDEVRSVCAHVRSQGRPEFSRELERWGRVQDSTSGKDDLFEEAAKIVLESSRGSASLLQRALQIGYTRAARLLEQMEDEGLVGPHRGSKPRDVLITLDDWLKRGARP